MDQMMAKDADRQAPLPFDEHRAAQTLRAGMIGAAVTGTAALAVVQVLPVFLAAALPLVGALAPMAVAYALGKKSSVTHVAE